jgi:uncharacterized protein (TIGR02145 family)
MESLMAGHLRVCFVCFALSVAFEWSWERLAAQELKASTAKQSSKRMAGGKQWTTQNLSVQSVPSYCYADLEHNCRQYGRLYTWESARRACHSLGDGWRLPTDDEWRQLAKQYGGMHDDAPDGGKEAYQALLTGGRSGFDALLGGGRSQNGDYARQEGHGFYWTATESDSATARYYNFGHGTMSLYRQTDGEKERAFSARCVRD